MAEVNTENTNKKVSRPRKKRRDTLRPIEFLYQQIYDVNSNIVLGYDAVLYINDKKLGTLDYDRITGVAEKSNLTVRLGKWQIEEVCEMIVRQNTAGKHIHRVFITLSAKHLAKPDFYESFCKTLEKYQIIPRRFCIQISETELATAPKEVFDTVNQLREGGSKVAITDFGGEASSLLRLSSVAVDYIKLDKAFTVDIDSNERTENLTEGIVELCEKMNVLVIADGIATKEQLNKMKKMRCFLIQGGYFSLPEREENAIM